MMAPSSDIAREVEEAASVVRRRLEGRQPAVAVVLGSGLGFLQEKVEDAIRTQSGRVLWLETSSLPAYELTRRFYLKNGYADFQMLDATAELIGVWTHAGVTERAATHSRVPSA